MRVSLLKHRTGPNNFSTLSSSIPWLTYRIKSTSDGWKTRIVDDCPLPGSLPGSVHIEDHMPGSLPIFAAPKPGSAQPVGQKRLKKRERVEATASAGTSARNRLNADLEGRVSLNQNPARIARHGPLTL